MIDTKLIIDLIPSERLKYAIYKNDFKFNEFILYKIAFHSVNCIEDRIKWSLYFSKNSEDEEVKDIAVILYNNLNNNCSLFKVIEHDECYNLIIKYKNKIFENIIYHSFDEAMTNMQQIVLCDYVDAGYRKSDLDISIYKKKTSQTDDNYESVIYINDDLEVENLYFCNDITILDDSRIDDFLDYYSWDNILFPCFFNDCDLVVINGDENDLSIDNLGVVRYDTEYYYKCDYFNSVAYVIRLNNSYIMENKLDEIDKYGNYIGLEYHTHIPFIALKFVDPNRLEKNEKDKLDYLINFIHK